MKRDNVLPKDFLRKIKSLEAFYLLNSDPIRQSGFSGGPQRWRAEREPILEAVTSDGDFLDIGCANGYLLECLMKWGMEGGVKITPFGLDIGARLIELAKKRLPKFKKNFYIGNAWDWQPPRKFRYVYSLYDCVSEIHLCEYVKRLMNRYLEQGGTLIIGAYGSSSKNQPAFDLNKALSEKNFPVSGEVAVGSLPITRIVWIRNQ